MPEAKFHTPRSMLIEEFRQRISVLRADIDRAEKQIEWDRRQCRELKLALQALEGGE